MSKNINLEIAGKNDLSSTACALLLPLTLLSNKNNFSYPEYSKKEAGDPTTFNDFLKKFLTLFE